MRDFTSVPRLIVIRSFDVNKPGEDVENLKGGVAGGSILQGVLRLGDQIEVRPGIVAKDQEGRIKCSPILSHIVSLYAEHNDLKVRPVGLTWNGTQRELSPPPPALWCSFSTPCRNLFTSTRSPLAVISSTTRTQQYAVPGGLIGVGTKIDPTLTRSDRLVGQVLGLRGHLPDVFSEVEISFYLLRRLLGVKTSDGGKQAKVQKLSKQEVLMVNIGSTATGGKVRIPRTHFWGVLTPPPRAIFSSPAAHARWQVLAVKNEVAKILLTQPVCTQEGEKIALSRRVDKHWRLIGWGQIRRGTKVHVETA